MAGCTSEERAQSRWEDLVEGRMTRLEQEIRLLKADRHEWRDLAKRLLALEQKKEDQ